jgi:mono/diheme cytochrome c family protein
VSRSAQAPTASASGRSRAASPSVIPTTCGRAVVLLALGLAVAGCGGKTTNGQSSAAQGKRVFASACAGCHTLTGHDTRAPGGDLAIEALTVADIESFVRVMPVRLTSADADAVAAYVHDQATHVGHG